MAGTAVDEALANGNSAFNEITDRIGRDNQKTAYENFKALKGVLRGLVRLSKVDL